MGCVAWLRSSPADGAFSHLMIVIVLWVRNRLDGGVLVFNSTIHLSQSQLFSDKPVSCVHRVYVASFHINETCVTGRSASRW